MYSVLNHINQLTFNKQNKLILKTQDQALWILAHTQKATNSLIYIYIYHFFITKHPKINLFHYTNKHMMTTKMKKKNKQKPMAIRIKTNRIFKCLFIKICSSTSRFSHIMSAGTCTKSNRKWLFGFLFVCFPSRNDFKSRKKKSIK